MNGERRRGGPPSPRKRPDLRKRVSDLERTQSETARKVRELTDTLHVKDNWHAEVRGWIGKTVQIVMTSGREYTGTLKWVDRYNVAVIEDGATKPRVLQKGNIESMSPGE